MELNRVGFVGWRGMVGSVLLQRMLAEDDFSLISEPHFFTTSQVGQAGPDIGRERTALVDAHDLDALANMEVVVTCQGGDYTQAVYDALRNRGWGGYWLDAASTLRLKDTSTIPLDPVNLPVIENSLAEGTKDFIGGNCTVSLMVMALHGLFNADLIEWISTTTYQAISGGGAQQMRELLEQMGTIHCASKELLDDNSSSILAIDEAATASLATLSTKEIGYPLAGSVLPWVDQDLGDGKSREEKKGSVETNKILARKASPILIESTCVRIGVLRCHSQAFTIKLKQDLPQSEIEGLLDRANDWVSLVANDRKQTLTQLTPAAVTGTLMIPIGRVRKLCIPGNLISAFSVGDQLLWGAAEPLRRMLRILSEWN